LARTRRSIPSTQHRPRAASSCAARLQARGTCIQLKLNRLAATRSFISSISPADGELECESTMMACCSTAASVSKMRCRTPMFQPVDMRLSESGHLHAWTWLSECHAYLNICTVLSVVLGTGGIFKPATVPGASPRTAPPLDRTRDGAGGRRRRRTAPATCG